MLNNPNNMLKRSIFTLAFTSIFVGAVCAQEPTNAFDDLARQGVVLESDSPMRIKASEAELKKLVGVTPSTGYFCFTESRENSVRMFDAIPESWAQRDLKNLNSFTGDVRPDEFYTFQVAVYAVKEDVKDLKIVFSDLKGVDGIISKDDFRCFNLGGVNLKGEKFTKNISVDKGHIQPLWIGVQVPASAKGVYKGTLLIGGSNIKSTTIKVDLNVSGDAVQNHGYDLGGSLSRLAWLDSQIGISETPTSPYVPVAVNGDQISYLGGCLTVGKSGFPSSIVTFYDEMNNLDNNFKNNILGSPMEFIVESDRGIEKFTTGNWELKKLSEGAAGWVTELKNDNFTVEISGRFEFDGSVNCAVKVVSLKDITIKDIRLKVPYTAQSSKYIVGMGHKGGLRTTSDYLWSWDTVKHQDAIWMGAVNAGMNIKLKDDNYSRPLVNIYYELGRLNMPKSWGNNAKGGVRFSENSSEGVDLEAYSGCRDMKKGESLYYDFELLITPVKPLDFVSHVSNRYYHSNSDVSSSYVKTAKEAGATRINVHHKKDIYPYINYPYYDQSTGDLTQFVKSAEKEGLSVGVYYTTRELTVKVPEIWALRSLGSEILHDGPGKDAKTLIHPKGPNEWLVKNFTTNFIPAWYNAFNDGKYKGDMDISVITTPDSRWNNYYLEGLDWMIKNMGLSGVYIDDSALDRETLKRARRILDADGKEKLLDIHSWNHFNDWAGYANSLHMYSDLLPYVDRIWIGEGFPESNSLDFWMVEMAGIPLGQLSETLDAQNIFKGMVYGMTPRMGWSGDPTYLWKMYDAFGMKDAKMYGYWITNPVVKSGNDMLPVTTYVNSKTHKAIVVVASWADVSANGKFEFDVQSLGFTPSKATLVDLGKVQQSSQFDINSTFTIQNKGGLILLLE